MQTSLRVLLVAYDNEMVINFFPQGLAYIAAVLVENGYDVEIYNQDKFHYPCEHLTEYLNKNKFDVVGVSIIGGYYQYKTLLKISEAINQSRNRPFYIIGGHGPSPEPEFFLSKTKADAVVMGEGEITVIELLQAIQNGESLATVKGIAYRNEEEVVVNKKRPLIKDIDSIPFPAFKLFPMDYYKLRRPSFTRKTDFVMRVLSGRGCPFQCNFCYRMDKGHRPRNTDSIIEEIQLLKEDYRITHISFTDDLLMSSVERVVGICEAFIDTGLNIRWDCNGRLNYAKSKVLQLMKKAGCVFINYGIEAMDDQVLKNMRKGLTTKMILKGVRETLEAGISPGLNIIFGNIGDNRQTLAKGVEFLLKYDDGAQLRTIRPVTPYPGSPLYYYAIEKGLLKDCEDFYENKHVNSDLLTVNFTDLDDEEFHLSLFEANKEILANYYQKKLANSIDECKKLYLESDASFRGFRQYGYTAE